MSMGLIESIPGDVYLSESAWLRLKGKFSSKLAMFCSSTSSVTPSS